MVSYFMIEEVFSVIHEVFILHKYLISNEKYKAFVCHVGGIFLYKSKPSIQLSNLAYKNLNTSPFSVLISFV